MKEIITPNGKLVLKPGTELNISKNNPLFTRAEDFSINLSVPRVPNDKLFEYQYPLLKGGNGIVDAQFLYNGVPKMIGSVELISGSDTDYEIILKGGRTHFMQVYGEVKLSEIGFEDRLFVPGKPEATPEEMVDEMVLSVQEVRDWIFVPVWNGSSGKWINPWSFNTNSFSWDASQRYSPFLRLHRVLEMVFEFYGYSIVENWFTASDERKKILVYNDSNILGWVINVKNLLPNWTIAQFVAELEDFFPVSFFVNSAKKEVKIIADDGVATSDAVSNLEPYVVGKPKITYPVDNGYELKYSFPSNDNSVSQRWDYVNLAWEETYPMTLEVKDSFSLISTPFVEGQVAYIVSEGMFYQSKASGEAFDWERTGNVANNVVYGNGDVKRETKIYPLLNTTRYVTEDVFWVENLDGLRKLVSFYMQVPTTNKSQFDWADDLRLFVYRGMDTATHSPPATSEGRPQWEQWPMANFVNRKMDGSRWAGNELELRWDTEQGLRGVEAIAFLDGAEKIEVKLLINHVDLDTFDLTKVYMFGGRRVMISELSIHYTESSRLIVDAMLLAQKQ